MASSRTRPDALILCGNTNTQQLLNFWFIDHLIYKKSEHKIGIICLANWYQRHSQAQVVHLLLVQGGGTSGVVVAPERSVNTSSYDYLTWNLYKAEMQRTTTAAKSWFFQYLCQILSVWWRENIAIAKSTCSSGQSNIKPLNQPLKDKAAQERLCWWKIVVGRSSRKDQSLNYYWGFIGAFSLKKNPPNNHISKPCNGHNTKTVMSKRLKCYIKSNCSVGWFVTMTNFNYITNRLQKKVFQFLI